ncbi:hypothetical protein [Marinibacterium sp. SX1]|uniref:hypothetical protein n=1 Tax=Marinibacterium sp. SX1 TaxID=3388424 RepID=UPI003D174D45
MMTPWMKAVATALALIGPVATTAQEVDQGKLSPGWMMHFYPITDTGKPDSPSGRSIATLLLKDGFPVRYRDPFAMEPALKKYSDRFWLLEFDGYLDLSESGPYTFALTYVFDDTAACGARLELEGKTVVELPLPDKRQYAPLNAYADLTLEAGLYRSRTQVYCTSFTSNSLDPEFEVSVRGPSDAILAPVSANMMKYLRR